VEEPSVEDYVKREHYCTEEGVEVLSLAKRGAFLIMQEQKRVK